MTEITDLNPVDESNTSLTGNGITGGNFVSGFDNAMRGLLGLLGRLNSGASPISDAFSIAYASDLTAAFRFDASGITPGQKRVITIPDQDLTLGGGTAASITFTPAGNIAATDVQAAIQELDTEKQPLDSDLTSWAGVARASGFDTFVATPSSVNLKALLTDETGSGAAVFADTPTLVTPVLGAATGTSLVLSGLATASAFVPSSSSVPTNGMFLPNTDNLGWAVGGAHELTLTSARLAPAANDGLVLGSATSSFSDLFLASGGIVNWNNGNFTLTHSSGVLTASGNIAVADDAYAAGWNGSANVPTKNAVYDKIELILGTTLPAAYQPLSANLTTYAGIAPSANVQSLLGAADYAAMRTQLSLVVGTNVQAYDADLATIAGLTATTDNFIVSVASAWASRTPAQVRTTLSLVIGTNVQAWDADLDSWAGVTRAAGFDTFTATPSIANLMSLLTDDASGLGTFMTTPSSANLRSLLTDETGTGVAVFGTSPGFTTAANPASNDGASLGTTTLNWSDVFVADGGVINWNNGDVTITHSSNALAFAGASSGYSFDAAVIAATVVGGTGAASALELKATTGNGVGSEYVKVTAGNNGAQEVARFVPNNSGGLLIGTTGYIKAITINSATAFDGLRFTVGSTSFDMAVGGSDVYLANLANGTLNLQTNSANRVTITGAGLVGIVTSFGRGAPVTKTGNFTVADTENWLINNKSGSSCTVTLPTASSWTGREIMFKNSQAQTVVSASSNVVPRATAAAGTAILASGNGNWCTMVSDGTNWVIMAGS